MEYLDKLNFLKNRVTYEPGENNDNSGSIVKYDVLFLLSYGWAFPFRGNMFTSEIIIGVVVGVAITTVLALFRCHDVSALHPQVERNCIPLPAGFSNNLTLTTVTSFLVGLFANTLLQRWWALRMHLLGHIGGNNEIIILLSTTLANSKLLNENPEYATEAKQACYAVFRYLNLANYLVIYNATKEFDYDKLLKKGIVTDSEYAMLTTLSGSPNIAYSWIDARLQKLANAGFLGPFPGPGHSNLSALLTAVGNARGNCIAVGVYIDTQLPYPFVQLVAFVVYACIIQVMFVSGGTIGQGFQKQDNSLVFTGYLTTILFIMVMRSLLLLYNILCNPLGDDAADFPSTTYLNAAEKGMLSLMNNVFSISLTSTQDTQLASYKQDESQTHNRTRLYFAPDDKPEPALAVWPGYDGGTVNYGSYSRGIRPSSSGELTETFRGDLTASVSTDRDDLTVASTPEVKTTPWAKSKPMKSR